MKKTTFKTRYHIQGSIDGGAWYDTDPQGFISRKKAERQYDRILRDSYPSWRGLTICWRIIQRDTTVTEETQIAVFSTPAHGEKRSLLGELFVPSWLPTRIKKRMQELPIPGAPDKWQPTPKP